MNQSREAKNKALVLEAFETLFNKRDYAAAEGFWSPDYIQHSALHGRFSGHGQPRNWIVADILRIENGKLAEHWDVIQDEVSKANSVSGLPMFGDKFLD